MESISNPEGSGKKDKRVNLGIAGENIARGYLESDGFRILKSRYRKRHGEVDLIAMRGRLLLFCEVKTSSTSEITVETYSRMQQNRMVELTQSFIAEFFDKLPDAYDLRYDLILVGMSKIGELEIKDHIEDAFRPQ
ncbi:MAG TPA: YraN family protein [bacterium]|jgi:putative endonuclease